MTPNTFWSPIGRTMRTGCSTPPEENCRSAPSMASISSSIDSRPATSADVSRRKKIDWPIGSSADSSSASDVTISSSSFCMAASIPVVTVMLSFAVLVPRLAHQVAAQERPRPVAEASAGALLFADDGVVTERFVGGAGRFYVTPRVSAGPELVGVWGDRHSHLMLTGNLTYDLIRPVSGEPRPVTPFLVAGAGLFQTRESFPTAGSFTSTEGAFTAGGGVRARVGEYGFVGAEARVGWELHIRLNALAGIRFGR